MKPVIIVIFLFSVMGCGQILGPEPSGDTLTAYDSFWSILNRSYAGFLTKPGNWGAVQADNRTILAANPTSSQLRTVLASIIQDLNDQHLRLLIGSTYIPAYATPAFDINVVNRKYCPLIAVGSNPPNIYYGSLNAKAGYLWLPTFEDPNSKNDFGSAPSSWTQGIPKALAALSDKQFLVIDLRDNGGGSMANGNFLVSNFLTTSVPGEDGYLKDGPGPKDFIFSTRTITPAAVSYSHFHVVLLVNESTYSAASIVTYYFKQFVHARLMGKSINAGLVGNPEPHELSNGWVLSCGAQNFELNQGACVDGDLLAVDQEVDSTSSEIQAGTDRQLQAAIDWTNMQP